MKTQHEQILEILRASGKRGMNSYEYRMRFIQIPVRIKELKAKGYLITTRQNKNRSVDYILIGKSGHTMTKKAPETQQEYIYVYEGDTAKRVLKSELKPVQLVL